MALSDEEQRRLDALEAAWTQDDPKFATTLRGRPRFTVARRGAALGLLGAAAGLALLVLGINTFFVISLVGYVMMLVGALALLGSVHRVEDDQLSRPDTAHPHHLVNQAFVDLLEQQRRQARPHDDP